MVAELLQNAERLRELRRALYAQSAATRSATWGRSLAECSFRLGVHPDVDASEALELLLEAHRLEPRCGKHAYHLGRIHWRLGRFAEAENWWRVAQEAEPTNERWRRRGHAWRSDRAGLPAQFEDSPQIAYERALEALVVASTRDSLVEFARRWSQFTNATRESPEWRAAWGALTVAGLVCGLAPATVRAALDDRFPPLGSASRDVVERICSVYEAPMEETASRLADLVARFELPASVAAPIHRQRCWSQPVEFRALGAYRAARRLLASTLASPGAGDRDSESMEVAESELDDAIDHLRRAVASTLNQGTGSEPGLRGATTSGPLGESPSTAGLTSPWALLRKIDELERGAAELTAVRDTAFAWLKSELTRQASEPEALGGGRYAANRGGCARLVERLAGTARGASERLQKLRRRLEDVERETLGRDFLERFDNLSRGWVALTSLANFERILQRLDRETGAARGGAGESARTTASSATLDPALDTWLEQVERLSERLAVGQGRGGHDEDFSGEESVAAEPDSHPRGAPGLAIALRNLEEVLDQQFARIRGSLAAYPEWCLALPAWRDLQSRARMREADLRFRLGQSSASRRLWHDVLRQDPFHFGALRNLAVADTLERETGRSIHAWTTYLHRLYDAACLRGDAHSGATELAEFHRVAGLSQAPPSFFAALHDDWLAQLDVEAVAEFLEGPGLSTWIDHELLAQLHARFASIDPHWMLGLGPRDEVTNVEKHLGRLLSWAEATCELVPERHRALFRQMVRQRLHVAAANHAKGATRGESPRSPTVPDALPQFPLLLRLAEFRFKLVVAAQHYPQLAARLAPFDFLRHLERLEQMPLPAQFDFAAAAASRMGLEPQTIRELPTMLRTTLVQRVVRSLVMPPSAVEDGDSLGAEGGFSKLSSDEQAVRRERYERLIGDWQQLPIFAAERETIEDSSSALPDELVRKLAQATPDLAAFQALRDWAEAYPRLGGLTRLYAIVMLRWGQFEEAETALRQALQQAWTEAGLAKTRGVVNQFRARRLQHTLQTGDGQQALVEAFEILRLVDASSTEIVEQAIVGIVEAAALLRTDTPRSTLRHLAEDWRRRAMTGRAAASADTAKAVYPSQVAPEPLNPAAITEVDEWLTWADARLAAASLGDITAADGAKIVARMDELLSQDPGHLGARFHRALGWFQRALHDESPPSRRGCLENAQRDVGIAAALAQSQALQRQVEQLRQEIHRRLGMPSRA